MFSNSDVVSSGAEGRALRRLAGRGLLVAFCGFALSACLTGGGGGRDDDGGVVPIGGQGGEGAAGGEGGAGATDGGPGGEGGNACTPNCAEKTCGSDGCGSTCGTCGDGLRCIEGDCSDQPCPAGTLDCQGVCTDVLGDPDNCGNCGNACDRPEGLIAECIAAECFATCPAQAGNGVNVDLQSDPNNCGTCNNRCPAIGGNLPACNAGVCADPCREQGLTGCGASCVDTNFDTVHCGMCNRVCDVAIGGSPSCEAGTCGPRCLPGDIECDGTCVALEFDDQHCGACNNRCGSGSACQDGVCTCPDGSSDLLGDADNCGACGNACPAVEGGDRQCANGRCLDACGGELNECNQTCVNLSADAEHCGVCGNACADYQSREPTVRFFLGDDESAVEDLNCDAGDCRKIVRRTFAFPNNGNYLTSCGVVCNEAGMACSPGGAPWGTCPSSTGRPAVLDASASGCSVYEGVAAATARALACDTVPAPRFGLSGDNLVSISCVCESVRPIVPERLPGAPIPAPGGYEYQMADYEVLVARYVPGTTAEHEVSFNTPGTLAVYDASGRELARRQQLQGGGPFVTFVGEAGSLYYITFRTFPERARVVQFQVLAFE